MDLKSLIDRLELKAKCGEDKLDREVTGGYVGDLLSDVMGNSKKGDLWITRQGHQNIVAVASLKELAGIVIALNSEPDPDTLVKARGEGIPIFTTVHSGFEIAGRLHRLLKPA